MEKGKSFAKRKELKNNKKGSYNCGRNIYFHYNFKCNNAKTH